jgi:hypothetical protein
LQASADADEQGYVHLADAGFRVEALVGAVPVPGVTTERLARVTHRIGNLRPSLAAYGLIVTAKAV